VACSAWGATVNNNLTGHVLLAEENPILAMTVSGFLAGQHEIRAEIVAARTLIQILDVVTDQTKLVVVDPDQLCETPEAIAQAIREKRPDVGLLGYASQPSRGVVASAIMSKFNGFISKRCELSAFAIAIETGLSRGFYLDTFCVQLMAAEGAPDTSESTGLENLSEREERVITMVGQGYTAKEIAHDLKISIKTVDTYRSRASKKLSLNGRREIVEYVHQNRLNQS